MPTAKVVAAHLQTQRQHSTCNGRGDQGELFLSEGQVSLGQGKRVSAHMCECGKPVADESKEVVEAQVA